jgi:hypothetical protein
LKISDEKIDRQRIEEKIPSDPSNPNIIPDVKFKKSYNWSNSFQISAVTQFTLQLPTRPLDQQLKLKSIGDLDLRNKVQTYIEEPEYIRITVKTTVGENVDSMFILIEEEPLEICEYLIQNDSKVFDLLYQ